MEIISVDLIPRNVNDVPIDKLLNVYKICQQMQEICENKEGVGLSAVQVGIPWKLFIMSEQEWRFFINCDYEPLTDEKVTSIEGCLSLYNKDKKRFFKLARWKNILLKGKTLVKNNGKLILQEINEELDANMYSVICQHEIDHQHGVLISDIGEEIALTI